MDADGKNVVKIILSGAERSISSPTKKPNTIAHTSKDMLGQSYAATDASFFA